MCACVCCTTKSCVYKAYSYCSLVPRLSRSNYEGVAQRGERACYTLFAHVLIILVIARVCIILENILEVSVMGVYKNTKIPKYVPEDLLVHGYAQHVAVHTTASDGLLGHSLAKLVAI